MTYLPEGYEVPKQEGGGYMKFKQGDNKFRILSEPIIGWQYWTEAKKPVRSKTMWNVVPLDADLKKGWPQKHFWAFVVWNFETKQIEILQLTQSTLLYALQSLINSEEWGDPREYSVTINRKGEGLETEYTMMPSPAKPIPKEIKAKYEEKPINLEALFSGGNPFDATKPTPAVDEEDLSATSFDDTEPAF